VLALPFVFAAWLVVAGLSLMRPSLGSALLLAAVSALWLPVNNGELEGPILYKVSADHGLTASDLLTYAGFALAALAGWRRRQQWLHANRPVRTAVRWLVTGSFVAVLLVLLGCGLAASWFEHTHGTAR